MLKRMLSLILALSMVVSFCPIPALAEESGSDPVPEILTDAAQEIPASAAALVPKTDHISSPLTFAVADGSLPFSEYEYEVLILTNRERVSRGYQPLMGFKTLQKAANIRAKEAYSYFSHTRPNGTSCFTVLDEVGIEAYGAGENIALGHRSPQEVVTAWMNSPGHRANILRDYFGFLGVGFYNHSWVQMFLGASGAINSVTVHIPQGLLVGTKLDEMNIYAAIETSLYGTCYLPITHEFVSGFSSKVAGPQEVRIDFLGLSGTCTITLVEKPDAPKVTAKNVASTGKIQLSWKAIEGAETYKVYRSDSPNGEFKLLKTTSKTSFTNTSTTAGKVYYYYLVAVDPYGNRSDKSKVVSRTCDLAQPEVTVSRVSSSGKIKVSWEKLSGAKEYQVYRASSEDGEFTLMKTTTSTSYTNTSAKAGNTYYYKVRAIGNTSASNSAYSKVHSMLCGLERPSLSLSNEPSTGFVRIQWDRVSRADRYLVCRSASKDGEYTELATTEGTGYTDTAATAGSTYYYKVKALHENSEADSVFSTAKKRTCDLKQPVISVSNIASSGKIQVTWTAVEGAVEYQVYRATSKSGTYKPVKTTGQTTYTHSSATAGKTYYYKVMAIAEKEAANSACSEVKSRTCDLKHPQVTIGSSSKGYPRLTWDKISGAEKYEIHRSEDGITWTRMKTTTSASYTNTSAEAGKIYYYKVRAITEKTSANSAYSDILTFSMA